MDLTAPIGTADATLASIDTIRIFHNPDPEFPGPGVGIPVVNTVVGIDNITADVPEPGTFYLLGVGLVWFVARRRAVHYER